MEEAITLHSVLSHLNQVNLHGGTYNERFEQILVLRCFEDNKKLEAVFKKYLTPEQTWLYCMKFSAGASGSGTAITEIFSKQSVL